MKQVKKNGIAIMVQMKINITVLLNTGKTGDSFFIVNQYKYKYIHYIMYFPEDVWHMILHEYLWPKNNKYWLTFKSRDKLMLELTDKNAKNFDTKTKELCNNYTKYSKFFHWIYIPKCFQEIIVFNRYNLIYELQKHTNTNIYILFERMKILNRYLKYKYNEKLNNELIIDKQCIILMIKKNKFLINTKIDQEIQDSCSNKLINLLEKIKTITIEIATKLHNARTSEFFK